MLAFSVNWHEVDSRYKNATKRTHKRIYVLFSWCWSNGAVSKSEGNDVEEPAASYRLFFFLGVAVAAAAAAPAPLRWLELGVPRYSPRDTPPLPYPLGHMRSTVATAVNRYRLFVLCERPNSKLSLWQPVYSRLTHRQLFLEGEKRKETGYSF